MFAPNYKWPYFMSSNDPIIVLCLISKLRNQVVVLTILNSYLGIYWFSKTEAHLDFFRSFVSRVICKHLFKRYQYFSPWLPIASP